MKNAPTWLKATAAIVAALTAITGFLLDSYGKGTPAPVHQPPTATHVAPPVGESNLAEPGDSPARSLPRVTVSVPGCKTALVRNFSSRQGAKVQLGILHWTAGADTPGSWAAVDATDHWFDTPASDASSSEIMGGDGRCALAVAEANKPWTQIAFNRVSVSVEITNPGHGQLVDPQGRQALIRLLVGWHNRWGIPLKLARTHCDGSVGVVDEAGINDHKSLGACGGGHPDVGNFDIVGLIKAAAATLKPTAALKAAKACLAHERKIAKRHGGWGKVAPLHLARARMCKAQLA